MDSNNSVNSTEVSDVVTSTSGMPTNLIILCHLYALLKQRVSEESIGPNTSTINPDTDINSDSDTAFIFSTADCKVYYVLKEYGYGPCAITPEVYNYDSVRYSLWSTDCFLFFFMTKMDAREKCFNVSRGYANNTKDENAMTLLSKDRILYSFMSDSLRLSDECYKNTTVSHEAHVKSLTSTTNVCNFYGQLKSGNAENICWPTSDQDSLSHDTTGEISHYECVWYRLLTELGGTTFCKGIEEVEKQHTDNKQTSCDLYDFVMKGIIGGVISVIGIVCNIGSVVMFRHRVIKTPTTYQLQWLALVDTIFLVLYCVYLTLYYIMKYLQIDDDNVYWRVILPCIVVFIWPMLGMAQTSTNLALIVVFKV